MKSQLNPQKYKSGRKRKSPLTLAKEKADKALQEWGRRTFKKCEVCGGKYSCLHHYFPKSTSTALRYNPSNLIPICQGCHFSHHNGNPIPHNVINEKRGEEWKQYLYKKKNEIIKANIEWYNWYKAQYESNDIQSNLRPRHIETL